MAGSSDGVVGESRKEPSPSPGEAAKGFLKPWAFVSICVMAGVLLLGSVPVVRIGDGGEMTQASKESDASQQAQSLSEGISPFEGAKHPASAIPYEEHAASGTLYALPDREPRGVAFLFHGCTRDAKHFFEPYPEDVRITRTLLDAGLAVVVFQSQDRESKCWGVFQWSPKDDVEPVTEGLAKFAEEKETALGLAGLPKLFIGFSSGGHFVTELVGRVNMDGALVYISRGEKGFSRYPDVPLPKKMAWLAMSQDRGSWAASPSQVRAQIEDNRQKEMKHRLWIAKPRPLEPLTLAERIAGVSLEQSKKAYELAREGGYLTETNLIQKDPRKTDIKKILLPVLEMEGYTEQEVTQHLSVVLNRLYCEHEMTDDFLPEMIEYLLEKRNRM
uniref:Uncharacterized protein n=1 Tax=Chromera velia CCMP2878 TaxID=1169474 RepID=A0A0G4G5G3_9ALVE|eukprot:Cvel_4194.t1-p1 / transcript=Cvel_4194.t1 / gene=Cvel_4194 / organism=Chromera_velia_CCMP2878 / gene_product=hypothetical protein / transcript_product=hypothetical protein / location=Cvel_scaffold181:8940-10100(+) / protein_length=387 / sequence_SO=supercontig / SO=protein_coding / is_pseudo=false